MLPPPPCTAAAAVAGLTLALAAAQPGDIVGPILSAHQARDTWQGKVASVLSGKPCVHEGGRPWMLVDARDVAMAEILMAESGNIESGERFMLSCAPPSVRHRPRCHSQSITPCEGAAAHADS